MSYLIPFAFGIVVGLFAAAAYIAATAEGRRIARDDEFSAPEGGQRHE